MPLLLTHCFELKGETKMPKVGVLTICLVLFAATALAENAAIAKRKKILKGFGDATKPIALMIKGAAPFNLALVKTALTKYSENTKTLQTLFPEDSKTGGKTKAKPAIWEEKEKFDTLFQKLERDARMASTSIVDEASFKSTMPKVLGDCKSCHDKYREKE